MTPLTAAPSRSGLFFAWFKTNVIACAITLAFFAGAVFFAVGAALSANAAVIANILQIVTLLLIIAGVAWLGAAQANMLGFSSRAGGLVMLLAAFAAVAPAVVIALLLNG